VDRLDCRLSIVRVFVRDWPRAVRFYTETLGIPLLFQDAELGWAQLATGQAQLALERFEPESGKRASREEALVGRFLGVSLAVADVEACYEWLFARGVDFLAPPELMSWGGVLAHLRDPEGNVLTLVGPPRGEAASPVK
jgi:catechol 2,3-dioxygenase-like lactoylglutathione lyase family enzyme